jgi:hypothetical protein
MKQVKNSSKKAVTTDAILNGNSKSSTNKVRKSVNNPKPTAKQKFQSEIERLTKESELAKLAAKELAEKLAATKKASGTIKQVVYLAEGATLKDLQKSKKATTQTINKDSHSISYCLKVISNYFSKDTRMYNPETKVWENVTALKKQFPKAVWKEITPEKVLSFATDLQKLRQSQQFEKVGYIRYTIPTVLTWVIAYFKVRNGYVKSAAKVVKVVEVK